MNANNANTQRAWKPTMTPFHLPERGAARRYAIWEMQISCGREPCYRTVARFDCEEFDCPLREECLNLCALWRQ